MSAASNWNECNATASVVIPPATVGPVAIDPPSMATGHPKVALAVMQESLWESIWAAAKEGPIMGDNYPLAEEMAKRIEVDLEAAGYVIVPVSQALMPL